MVSDITGELKEWFDQTGVGSVILRPDKFVAAVALNAQLSQAWRAVREAGSLTG